MRSLSVFFVGLMVSGVACLADDAAAPRLTLQLWPEARLGAPTDPQEKLLPDCKDSVTRITNISHPSMTLYRAVAKEGELLSAVMVFPGGGYSILAINKEGGEIAEWLNRMGVAAIVVKYRVPNNRQGAFEDGQRAIRLVRHHAKEWGIDPQSVGVIGFSAGGHLSARLSADFDNPAYEVVDEGAWSEGEGVRSRLESFIL